MADGLLNKASIILTPTGYKAGTLYNVAPVVEPYEDFDFARASVASRVNSSGLVEMVGRTLGSELVQNGDFSELGSELNDLTWSAFGGWSIVDGVASNDGSGSTILNEILEIGKTYKITIQLSTYTSGNFSVFLGSNTESSQFNGTDEFTFYGVCSGDAYARVKSYSGIGSINIQNVSVKEVDPNDYWTLGTDWSIGDNALVGNSSITENEQRIFTTSVSRFLKITFDAVVTSGEVAVYMEGSTKEWVSTSGSYTIYDNSSAFDLEIDGRNSNPFTGSITNVSVKEIIDTNNIPRISYDSNGDNGHILLEPTSTNLVTYSEDFENSYYNDVNNITVINNSTTSPDNTINASKITGSVNNSYIGRITAFTSQNTTVTASVFLKADTITDVGLYYTGNLGDGANDNLVVDLSNGTITSEGSSLTASITDFGNGWYRVISTYTTNGTGSILGVRLYAISSGSFFAWGLQLEALSYATSYIPTLMGSTETRATETATGAGSADLINSTEGVLYAEIATLSEDNNVAFKSLSLAFSSTNKVMITTQSTSLTQVNIRRSDDASNKFVNILTPSESVNFNKIAILYKSGENKIFVNGSRITNTDFDTFTFDYVGNSKSFNKLEFANGSGISNFQGKVKAVAVFNEALSDSELNNLTG